MAGVSRETGQPLDGWDHVRQSIAVILTTPIGSRVMRREFGSHLYKLIGRPMTKANILTVYAATALAISGYLTRACWKRWTWMGLVPYFCGVPSMQKIGVWCRKVGRWL